MVRRIANENGGGELFLFRGPQTSDMSVTLTQLIHVKKKIFQFTER